MNVIVKSWLSKNPLKCLKPRQPTNLNYVSSCINPVTSRILGVSRIFIEIY
jgi:hypothetical protein